MKSTGYIFLVLAVLFLSSCLADWEEPTMAAPVETSGLMQITVEKSEGDAVDKMETVRFFVFKNANSSPQLELNELFTIPAGSGGEVSEFNIVLEVSRKVSGSNDKIVVAVINEPTSLAWIATYNQLHNLTLEFSTFLNTSHTALEDDCTLPMTGVVWTDKVYPTPEEASDDPATLTVERTVARVDVYVRKEAGVAVDLRQGSTITLENSYDKSYFIRNEIAPNTNIFFGQIQTVSSGFKNYTFTQTTTKAIPVVSSGNDGELICSFYTPERTCIAPADADKLNVKFNILSTDGDNRSGEVLLDTATREGESASTPLTEIRRNNSYKVIATVENKAAQIRFSIRYSDWYINQQYEDFD